MSNDFPAKPPCLGGSGKRHRSQCSTACPKHCRLTDPDHRGMIWIA
eukprot:CAMPEP_0175824810 /NCGR_PEP_ID=MMETSP0107_2-20121207/10918_1 /TAXON_ID=195067 ORGANISM="Goniomonas pacifica, Strain CCMP1869" /NCGR_SAMPLE_ID=MMETSP0107_2 /ASSEMBLY_ACC=CAM_ASM_000203 /LENGTH=45 /DNA_ID= /DNA_START= /DNA_END= /DNA_ORIENTATION=